MLRVTTFEDNGNESAEDGEATTAFSSPGNSTLSTEDTQLLEELSSDDEVEDAAGTDKAVQAPKPRDGSKVAALSRSNSVPELSVRKAVLCHASPHIIARAPGTRRVVGAERASAVNTGSKK